MDLVLIDAPLCNDGSSAGFYYEKSASPEGWILFLEGGGFCFNNISCSLRWKYSPSLMSSKGWSKTYTGTGILSNKPTENQFWHNYNKVFIKYCSSDSHSGLNSNSDLGWKFLGSAIVDSIIDYLVKHEALSNAKNVIFTGSSAGAEGLWTNADRVASKLSFVQSFRVLADSGWFLDYKPFNEQNCNDLGHCTEQKALQLGVPHWKPRLDSDCDAAKSPDHKWECILGYHAYPYLSSPTFVFAFRFDAAGLGHDGILHIPQTQAEIAYASEAATNITKSFAASSVTAVYSPSCYTHTIEQNGKWNNVKINGKSYPEIAHEWTLDPKRSFYYVDTCQTANCNPTCTQL
eukprot:TRINITY_DN1599_c0_g1_i1.p1 TRINITY_DN1599_c0_g1~~TRINITY_DN1599_c0_g1_i1.p1  ORF type:complete len:364 (+),score=39.32 TRINITY_DN1599_c0_g1_i1:53-1093(+)